jgi:peptidoglycan/LPS O-acetylase OafA/YrhL
MAIDTLRGLAIVALVAYHSQDAEGGSVRHVDSVVAALQGSLHLIIDSFQMPLFAALAGYVYAMRPVAPGKGGSFLMNKVRRLLVPFVAAVTLTVLLKLLTPGVTRPVPLSRVWQAYLFSYEHFWFLQSLFVVFMVIVLMEAAGMISRPSVWALCVVVALILPKVIPGSAFFSLWGAMYLLPFFLMGCGLQRFPMVLSGRWFAVAAAVMAVSGLVGIELFYFGQMKIEWSRTGLLAIWTGMGLSYLLLRVAPTIPMLAALGTYSYGIYLYHGLALAIAQRGFAWSHSDSADLAFLLKWVCGLSLPVFAEMIIRKSRVLRRILLGQ